MAGVIQIRTRSGEGGPRAELHGLSGTWDSYGGSLFAGGSAGALAASVFLEGGSSDGYRDRADYRANDSEGSFRAELGEGALLWLRAGYSDDERHRPGSLTPDEADDDPTQADPDITRDVRHARQRFVDGRLELEPRPGLRVELQGYARRRDDELDTSIVSPFPFDFAARSESHAYGLTGELELDTELFGQPHRLLLGLDRLEEKVDRTSFSDDDNRRTLYGVYLQDEVSLREDLRLSLGVRYEDAHYHGTQRIPPSPFPPQETSEPDCDDLEPQGTGTRCDTEQTVWGPRAALTWRLAPAASLYASYARGFRLPNIDEVFGFFGSSPGLDAQKSDAYEVGAKLRAGRVSGNLALFTMDVEDEIFFDLLAGNPPGFPEFVGRNVNLGEVRHRGVEVQASWWALEWLELFGSYTYDDVKITDDPLTGLEGESMPITPRQRGYAELRLIAPAWLAPGLELALHGRYVGSRRLANDHEGESRELPKYASYDLVLRASRPLARWLPGTDASLELAVRNLFDRQYSEWGGLSSFGGVGLFPSPGRHYTVDLRLRWGGA
jgi:outer membrane receptor protein involved in Fe transport